MMCLSQTSPQIVGMRILLKWDKIEAKSRLAISRQPFFMPQAGLHAGYHRESTARSKANVPICRHSQKWVSGCRFRRQAPIFRQPGPQKMGDWFPVRMRTQGKKLVAVKKISCMTTCLSGYPRWFLLWFCRNPVTVNTGRGSSDNKPASDWNRPVRCRTQGCEAGSCAGPPAEPWWDPWLIQRSVTGHPIRDWGRCTRQSQRAPHQRIPLERARFA